METAQQTTLLGSATSTVQDSHRTSARIRLHPKVKLDEMTGGETTDGAKTGIAMTGSARTKGGNVFHLHHQGMNTGIRMLLTSCSSASATTSEAGKHDTGR